MNTKVIAVGVVGLVVGSVGGAAATWGLDPAEEPVDGCSEPSADEEAMLDRAHELLGGEGVLKVDEG